MEPVVLALASNERYFPGLYCAVASALSHLDTTRKLDLKVLDGGISRPSRDALLRLVDRVGGCMRLEFVTADLSVFGGATLGPGRSHMTYCRILLPHLLNVPRLVYLDCDVLVFRDLSELFNLELSPGKVLAAVPDSETLSLAEDCPTIERSIEFLNAWRANYRFWDQSAINFLLQGKIQMLPEYWNRASWRFDAQQNNDLDCVLHYTASAPWLGGTFGPAQVLFERFAAEADLRINRQLSDSKRSARRNFWRNALAPLRALAFPITALLYRIAGRRDKSAAYEKVARYWFDYVRTAPNRWRLYRRRNQEINRMKFDLGTSVTTQ